MMCWGAYYTVNRGTNGITCHGCSPCHNSSVQASVRVPSGRVACWEEFGPGAKEGNPRSSPTATPLVNLGGSGCTTSNRCSACEGDCDHHGECADGLYCFQRGSSEPVPGCAAGGSGDVAGRDYCYSPPTAAPRPALERERRNWHWRQTSSNSQLLR